jgi:uncharacterized protein YejL (UPF0352 family)/energy-coupling factor transporter ATP-binding protein EcfA2
MDENRVTYFAETDARNKRVKFGIKAKDRTRHVYVIGKTGMGKSTLLENMAVQDIQNGEGMAFIDPHGKTADLLLEYVPKERIRDVIHIAPFDTDYPISFNVLESIDPAKRHLVVSGLMSTFKKIWEDAWSARMEYILTNTLLALLEAPGTTLLGVNRMLSDKAYRNEIVNQVKDPSVKSFWTKEFANYTERTAAEAVPAIQNKVGQFTANPLIRNMIGQPVSSFDFRKAMDERKIIIINLSKGRVGDENMKLLGGLLVTKIYLAAMSRADMPDRIVKGLPNFYLYVDEFQNFANASFADILSEARKYKLNLTIAHQYVEQMDEDVSAAVFGNVGTMIVFRVGATDAEALEKEFSPSFMLEDLVNLGFAQIYLKLMIDGLTSPPFSAKTLPPIAQPAIHYVTEIIAASREQFARPRAEVEEIIIKFHEPTVKAPVASKGAVPSKNLASDSKASTVKLASPSISSAASAASVASAVSAASAAQASAAVPTAKVFPTAKAVPEGSPSVSLGESVKKVDTSANQTKQMSPSPASKYPTSKYPASKYPASKYPASKSVVSPKSVIAPSAPVHQPFKEAFKAVIKPLAAKPAPLTAKNTVVDIKAPKPPATPNDTVNLQALISSALKDVQPLQSTIVPALTKPLSTPLPLSSLNKNKSTARVDPKVPTPENVSQLKNALAAALAKHKATPSSAQAPKPASQAQPIVQQVPATTKPPSLTSAKEVPEDVLKKILKID